MGFKNYTVSIVNNAFIIQGNESLLDFKHSYFPSNDDVTFTNNDCAMTIPLTYISDVQEVKNFLEILNGSITEEPVGISIQISQLLEKMSNEKKGKQPAQFITQAVAPSLLPPQLPSAPPPVIYTYSAYFAQGQVVVQSTILGVFNVVRGRNSWLIPNAKINFNPEGTAFWADLNDGLAMHCVRAFINSKPGFFANAQYVLQSLPQAIPMATFNVDANYQPPPPPKQVTYAPPIVLPPNKDQEIIDEFFEGMNNSSTGGRISPSFDATLPKPTASSPGATSEYPDFAQKNNQEKLEIIMKHKAWGTDYKHDDFLFKDSKGLMNQIEENNWNCFISHEICNQAVVLPDSGKTVDLASLNNWRLKNNTDPHSRAQLPEKITTAKDMNNAINTFLIKRFNELEAAVGVKNKLSFN